MPGIISDQVLDQIRQHNDVVEVIGAYFPLKRAGANFRALCPFHKEKTPSFNVHPGKQIWHCFGCGKGGDVFTFVMAYENLDFPAAVRRLADRAGIRLEFTETAGGPTRDEKQALLRLHEAVAAYYHDQLLKSPAAEPARAYLARRQISLATARNWQIGYSPDAWDALIHWARSKKFSPALLEAAGLALRRERGPGEESLYDRFRGRLMFPIADEQGRVVAFSGRILSEAKDQPKYVNSPETPLFQKGRILFGLHKARRAMADEQLAIVCEGQLDTITCQEAGLANVVAPQGTALTEQHARILKRYTNEVVLMFDADAAGQNAAVRSADALLAADLAIRVTVLPEGHDPDSYLKAAGVDRLREMIRQGTAFMEFLLDYWSRQFDPRTDAGKLRMASHMVESIAKVSSPVLRSTYVRQTAARLDVPEEALLAELRKFKRGLEAGPATTERVPDSVRLPGVAAEEVLLMHLLSDSRLIDGVAKRLEERWLSRQPTGELIRRLLHLQAQQRWAGPSSLLNELTDPELAQTVSGLLLRPRDETKAEAAVNDCLGALERIWVEREWQQVRKRLAGKSLTSEESARLHQQVLDLRRRLDHIASLSRRTGSVSPQDGG